MRLQSWTVFEDDPHSTVVANAAKESLKKSLYTAIRTVWCDYDQGTLFLRGRLASYYQKQAAQEAVRYLEGVDRVVNQIEVSP